MELESRQDDVVAGNGISRSHMVCFCLDPSCIILGTLLIVVATMCDWVILLPTGVRKMMQDEERNGLSGSGALFADASQSQIVRPWTEALSASRQPVTTIQLHACLLDVLRQYLPNYARLSLQQLAQLENTSVDVRHSADPWRHAKETASSIHRFSLVYSLKHKGLRQTPVSTGTFWSIQLCLFPSPLNARLIFTTSSPAS